MILYYITDRKQFPGGGPEQRQALLHKIADASEAGVDYVQLRERDLSGRDLEGLARDAVAAARSGGSQTRLLINSRVDIALASGADGVHLRADDISASDARAIARQRTGFIVAVSCHTVEEVRAAWSHGADLAVFGPVFEKDGNQVAGVEALRQACALAPGFVIGLGGVTLENARICQSAGVAGIAGIRLFQDSDIPTLVALLRSTEGQRRREKPIAQ